MAYVHDTRLVELLTGKRVAIVGPARSLMGKRFGRALDDYDIIARVNEVYPFEWVRDYGNRTDIMIHSFGGPCIPLLRAALKHNAFVARRLQFMVAPQLSGATENRLSNAANINHDPAELRRVHRIPFHHCGDDWWQSVTKRTVTTPNTGFLGICALLEYDIAELLITGMTYYREGEDCYIAHYPGYIAWGGEAIKRPSETRPHQQDPQIAVMRQLMAEHPDIVTLGADVARTFPEYERVWHPTPGDLYTPDVEIGDMVRGRRVAIVGPATYLQGARMGEELDGYDIVVRINQTSAGRQGNDYGHRTDLLFTACGESHLAALSQQDWRGLKAVVMVNERPRRDMPECPFPVHCHRVGRRAWYELGRDVGWEPNTGIAAIALLLRHYSPAELFVTGFSFYQEGQGRTERHCAAYLDHAEPAAQQDETFTAQSGRRNQEPQRLWLAARAAEYADKLHFDARLGTILGLPTTHTRSANVRPIIYAAYRSYYGEDFIRASIESVLPQVDKVLVFWTDRAFADVRGCEFEGEYHVFRRPPDRLLDIVSDIPGVTAIYDHWGVPDEQWSHLINDRILPHFERPSMVLCMESDMVWRQSDLEQAIALARSMGDDEFVGVPQIELWRDLKHVVTRTPPRCGPVFAKIGTGNIRTTGKHSFPSGDEIPWTDAPVYNLGFAVSPKSMLLKHLAGMAFSAAINDSKPNPEWYRRKWLTWDYATNNEDLEIALGHEHNLPRAEKYDGPLPETLANTKMISEA